MNWTPAKVDRFHFQREMKLKALHKKNLVKAKKIVTNSIKDQLMSQVSSLKTPKEIFYFLTKLFEGKNIYRKMTLRNQFKKCEDPEYRDHTVILYKDLSNQRTT